MQELSDESGLAGADLRMVVTPSLREEQAIYPPRYHEEDTNCRPCHIPTTGWNHSYLQTSFEASILRTMQDISMG